VLASRHRGHSHVGQPMSAPIDSVISMIARFAVTTRVIDLYLTCAKFVTTPQYAPRLRERLKVERQLASDAEDRGWDREVDRHHRIADRIRVLLTEFGEPGGPPGAAPGSE
jgi:hypothetical protein